MTEEVLVERVSTRLSLAVSLVDDYSDGQTVGDIKVTLDGKQAIRNPGGYHLFLDFDSGDYTLKVETQYYSNREVIITLPFSDEAVEALMLKPAPNYPFSETATLVRGVVRDATDKPIHGATVRILGKDAENRTSQVGEFVLYFKSLTADDIIRVNGKRYIRADSASRLLQLQVTHPEYKKKVSTLEVEESKTASVFVTLKKKGG